MYNLIVTLVAIGLLSLIAGAGVYYLGSVTNDAHLAVDVSTLTTQVSQISTSALFYTVEHVGVTPPTIASLKDSQYLNQVPSGWLEPPALSTIASFPLSGANASNVCVQFNARYGIQGVPKCTDSGGVATAVCCQ